MRPVIDRSSAQGIGRHAENCRRRRANLEVDRRQLAELKKKRRGAVDFFRRTLEQLEYSISCQERELSIAESVS